MPLPKPQINWIARFAVLLIGTAMIGLIAPILWLLSVLHAGEWLLALIVTIWVVVVVLSVLLVIAVWAPERGRKFAELVLKNFYF
jgi:hypothetical protein